MPIGFYALAEKKGKIFKNTIRSIDSIAAYSKPFIYKNRIGFGMTLFYPHLFFQNLTKRKIVRYVVFFDILKKQKRYIKMPKKMFIQKFNTLTTDLTIVEKKYARR